MANRDSAKLHGSTRAARPGWRLVFATLFAVMLSQALTFSIVRGQERQTPVFGLETELDVDLIDEAWVDPIVEFELENEPLAPVPEFDLATLHPSDVFEEGVEGIAVSVEVDVAVETEQHLRTLQAVATAQDALVVAGQDIVSAQRSITSGADRIAAAANEIVVLGTEIEDLRAETALVTAEDEAEIATLERLNSSIGVNQRAIIEFAIRAFIGADDSLEFFAADPLALEPVQQRVVADEIRISQRREIDRLEGLVDEAHARRFLLADELSELQSDTDALIALVDALEVEIDDLVISIADSEQEILDLEEREDELDITIEDITALSEVTALRYQIGYHERLPQFVEGTDVPLVALNAYVRASRTLSVEDPSCGIHWSQLAGIGRIESQHGHFASSTLDINGHTTTPIIGIALDGRILSGAAPDADTPDATGRTEQTGDVSRLALIRDTDGGRLDGDAVFDRAVGPMQFIPTTWSLYDHSDGDGDDIIDPQNIYDATLASARYLCDAPGSMLTPEGEQAAYFAYNHDLQYSQNVTLAGRRYHDALRITPEASPNFASYAASGAAEAQAAAALVEPDLDEAENQDDDAEPDEDESVADPDSQGASPDAGVDTDVLGTVEDNEDNG